MINAKRKLTEVCDKACGMLRGAYARAVVAGQQRWSGADLRGKAKNYGSTYARQRHKAEKALEAAGGEVVVVEHGRLVTGVALCVDDYGNQIYLTATSLVRPLTRAQCRSITDQWGRVRG
jgi:hypothetical protein